MEPRSLEFVCAACEGELRAGTRQAVVRRVTTDSRDTQAGDLFFALSGPHFDGHAFLPDVARKDAVAVVVEAAKIPTNDLGCAVIAVDDTRRALGRLAARHRAGFDLPVIAVAGSNGKTTTKELLAAVLRERFSTLASPASFNNDVGVPLTLLKLERSHAVAVLEVGTNHPKELRPLVQMAVPQFGLITNIGREHLEFFGDLAGVAQEEGTLAELLPASGKLFLHGDNEWTPAIARRSQAPVVRIGWGADNEWRAEAVQMDDQGTTFQCVAPLPGFSGEYHVPLLGRHQAVNALFAIAVAADLGMHADEIRRGLLRCPPPKLRLQSWTARGVRVLDDSYNANADSMRVALQTLRDLPCAGRRVAVLGDMAELGAHSATAHREAGRLAAEWGVTRLIVVGRCAHETAEAARNAGLKDVTEFTDVAATTGALRDLVQAGDLLLLKASRAMGLERVGDALRGEAKNGKP